MRNFGLLIANLLAHLIRYLAYFPFTVAALEVFTILLILFQGTGFETYFIKIISYTPTLGIWGRSDFEGGTDLVMRFFAFWSFVFMVLDNLAYRLLGNKIGNKKTFLILFTLIHLLTIIRRWNEGMTSFIVFFYLLAGSCLVVYYLLKKLSQSVLHKFA